MQHRANFFEGFNLRGLPYYRQRELLGNARPWPLGYDQQLGSAPKFLNHVQLKEREDWLQQLGLSPIFAHELAMNTMEQPEFNLQHFQQRWNGLCQRFGYDRGTEANTIVLREIRELMQRARESGQMNLQRGNLPMPGGLDYPTNTHTLKYMKELALYQRRTSTPVRGLHNMEPDISPIEAKPMNFEIYPGPQETVYPRQQPTDPNDLNCPQEDAYNIDADPRNCEEYHRRQPPEPFGVPSVNNTNNLPIDNYRNGLRFEYDNQNQREENNYNFNNVQDAFNIPSRYEYGYNYNQEERRRETNNYENNQLNDPYGNRNGNYNNLGDRSDMKNEYEQNHFEKPPTESHRNNNEFFTNVISHLREFNSEPKDHYKNETELNYREARRREEIIYNPNPNNHRVRIYENIPNVQRRNFCNYNSNSEKERKIFSRRDNEIQRYVGTKSNSRNDHNERKRLADPINEPEMRANRRRRLEEQPKTFKIGIFKMPYVTNRNDPLPQPERKSYAIDFCQREHVLIIGGKNATPAEKFTKEILPLKFSKQSCKSTRKALRNEWPKVYEDNHYRFWVRWWKDFKWCQAAIEKELKIFNGMDLGRKIFWPDTYYFERPHSVEALLKRADAALQENSENTRTFLNVLFELMNPRFLRKLNYAQQGKVQDIIRYFPNSTWVNKMRFIIYLWSRCSRIHATSLSPSSSLSTTLDIERQIHATHTLWYSGEFHWLAKQAYDELISISEYEWPEHKNSYPIL